MIIYACVLITFNGVKKLFDESLTEIALRVKSFTEAEKSLNHRVIVESLTEIEVTNHNTKRYIELPKLTEFFNHSYCR